MMHLVIAMFLIAAGASLVACLAVVLVLRLRNERQARRARAARAALATPARLDAVLGPLTGRSFELRLPATTVGSVGGNHIVVPDSAVSRLHSLIRRTPAGLELSDLGATNGVWVNGERLRDALLLVPGDRLRVGESEFVFAIGRPPADENLGSSSP